MYAVSNIFTTWRGPGFLVCSWIGGLVSSIVLRYTTKMWELIGNFIDSEGMLVKWATSLSSWYLHVKANRRVYLDPNISTYFWQWPEDLSMDIGSKRPRSHWTALPSNYWTRETSILECSFAWRMHWTKGRQRDQCPRTSASRTSAWRYHKISLLVDSTIAFSSFEKAKINLCIVPTLSRNGEIRLLIHWEGRDLERVNEEFHHDQKHPKQDKPLLKPKSSSIVPYEVIPFP